MNQGVLVFSSDNQVLYYNTNVQNLLNIKDSDKKINCQRIFSRKVKIYSFLSDTLLINSKKKQNKFSYLKKLLKTTDITEIKCIAMIKESSQQENTKQINSEKYNKYELTFQKIFIEEQINFLVLFKNLAEEEKLLNEFNEFKNRLFQSFSHEIKTPLNGAIIPIQLCLTDDECPQQLKEKYLLQSNSSLQKLKFQIYDIIDMQLILENQFSLNISQINLKELIMEMIDVFKPIIKEKELDFLQKIDNNLPELIFTDPQRLNQIVYNLLSNAIKFTRNGHIIFSIKKINQSKCKIKILDTGTGMSESQKNRLKLILQTPDFSIQTGQSKNMSLGLTISQNLALSLGANKDEGSILGFQKKGITFKSQENKGSSFKFEIFNKEPQLLEPQPTKHFVKTPVNQSQENKVSSECQDIFSEKNAIIKSIYKSNKFQNHLEQQKEIESQILQDFHQDLESNRQLVQKCDCKQILIVDDDIFNLKSLELLLNKFGFQVEKAHNGKEAVEIFAKKMIEQKCFHCNGITIIFMDYQMPILDGVQATQQIRAIINYNKLPDIPIIACSAFDTSEDVQSCKNAGMNQYIKKPIPFLSIKNILAQYDILKDT